MANNNEARSAVILGVAIIFSVAAIGATLSGNNNNNNAPTTTSETECKYWSECTDNSETTNNYDRWSYTDNANNKSISTTTSIVASTATSTRATGFAGISIYNEICAKLPNHAIKMLPEAMVYFQIEENDFKIEKNKLLTNMPNVGIENFCSTLKPIITEMLTNLPRGRFE